MQSTAVAEPPEMKRFSPRQRAAALMLALGQEHGAPIWEQLSIDEMKELSASMASLGQVPASVIEHVLLQFSGEISSMATCHGSLETTERLLISMMGSERVNEIMEEIRGPSGRTMWDKLSNVSESVLAGYLRNEHAQTVAVILTKLRPEHAARVLGALPRPLSVEVVQRMLRMDTVQKEVLAQVETTLKTEFMANFARAQRRDPHEAMAELFNAMDRSTEESMLEALDAKAPEAAERIRALMFTFEDLANLLPASIGMIVRQADKRQMALALKGAPEVIRQLFFSTMTERSAKLLREDMASMGPVRSRDCEDAQSALVRLAKQLADSGEIVLVDPKSDDTMIV